MWLGRTFWSHVMEKYHISRQTRKHKKGRGQWPDTPQRSSLVVYFLHHNFHLLKFPEAFTEHHQLTSKLPEYEEHPIFKHEPWLKCLSNKNSKGCFRKLVWSWDLKLWFWNTESSQLRCSVNREEVSSSVKHYYNRNTRITDRLWWAKTVKCAWSVNTSTKATIVKINEW